MANKKRELNRIQLKHSEEDIEIIFERINEEFFSEKVFEGPSRQSYRQKLAPLKIALVNFKTVLELEKVNKDKFTLKTARRLEEMLSELFNEPNMSDKQKTKIVKQFWHYSRRARFSQRTKAILFGIVGGLFFLCISLILIFATGGASLIGTGIGVAISFSVGILGGLASAIVKFLLKPNKYEKRGKEIRDALLSLIKDPYFDALVNARNQCLFKREPSALVKSLRQKYLKKENKTEEPAPTPVSSQQPSWFEDTTQNLRKKFGMEETKETAKNEESSLQTSAKPPTTNADATGWASKAKRWISTNVIDPISKPDAPTLAANAASRNNISEAAPTVMPNHQPLQSFNANRQELLSSHLPSNGSQINSFGMNPSSNMTLRSRMFSQQQNVSLSAQTVPVPQANSVSIPFDNSQGTFKVVFGKKK